MVDITWKGWQTSVSDAAMPTGVVYGANLRKRSKQDSPKQEQEGLDSDDQEHNKSETGNNAKTEGET